MSAFGNEMVTLLTAQVGKHNFYARTGFPKTVYAAHPTFNRNGFPWDSALVAWAITASTTALGGGMDVTINFPPVVRIQAHDWEKVGTANGALQFGTVVVLANGHSPNAGDVAVFEGAHVGVVSAYDSVHQMVTVLDGSRIALDPDFRVYSRKKSLMRFRTFIRFQ